MLYCFRFKVLSTWEDGGRLKRRSKASRELLEEWRDPKKWEERIMRVVNVRVRRRKGEEKKELEDARLERIFSLRDGSLVKDGEDSDIGMMLDGEGLRG